MNIVDEFDYENPENFIEECIEKDTVIVAEIDNKIIGFLLYQKLWGHTPFLALVNISEDYQRKGVWKWLVQFFEEKLLVEWYGSYVSSTELNNRKAQKFQNKLWLSSIGELDMSHWIEVFYIKNIKK